MVRAGVVLEVRQVTYSDLDVFGVVLDAAFVAAAAFDGVFWSDPADHFDGVS